MTSTRDANLEPFLMTNKNLYSAYTLDDIVQSEF